MKIGILTFHRPINYGAFLQSYCLSNALKSRFKDSEVEIIDYIASKENNKVYLDVLRDLKHYGISAFFKSIKKLFVFRNALKYLPLSKRKLIGTDIKKLFEYVDKNYDVLVIGSDAVFNWKQNGYPTAYIPNYDFHIPVLTYAASAHGLKYYDIENKKLSECADAFSKMDFVGVRDACTEQFVKYCNSAVDPVHCCDPTFLFTDVSTEYCEQAHNRIDAKYARYLDRQYIVLMIADSAFAEEIANKYREKYRIIALFKPSSYADVYIHDADPFEWTQILKGASLVVTSYFHGTLLSLVQDTPVIVVDYSNLENSVYQSKLCDLMVDRLKLGEFYFTKEQISGEKFDFDELFCVTDSMINGEYTEKISEAVSLEKKNYNDFEDVVLSIYKKEK